MEENKYWIAIKKDVHLPEFHSLQFEMNFHNPGGFYARTQDIVLGGQVAGLTDAIHAIQETRKVWNWLLKSWKQRHENVK